MANGLPAHAEVIADTDTGDTGGSEELNEKGLTAEEQTQFDEMMRGEGGADAGGGGRPPIGDPPADTGDEDDGEEGEEDAAGEGDEPAPAVKEPTDKDPAAAKDPTVKPAPKQVSYGKYQRERQKMQKQMAEQAATLERERADRIKLGERLSILNEALTAAAPADPAAKPVNPWDEPDVDPNDDVWKALDQERRRNRFLFDNQATMQQQGAAERAEGDLKSNYIRDANAYTATTPDFPEAYNFMKDVRLVEIAIAEFDKDPRDPAAQFTERELSRVVQLFNEEEKYLAESNFAQRRSPAATIYKMATVRGYKPKAAEAPAPAAGAPKPANGTAVVPRRAPVVAEVENLRRAAENGKSLSDGGSTSDVTTLTPDRLLAMGDDEFDEMIEKLSPRKMQELMGREA